MDGFEKNLKDSYFPILQSIHSPAQRDERIHRQGFEPMDWHHELPIESEVYHFKIAIAGVKENIAEMFFAGGNDRLRKKRLQLTPNQFGFIRIHGNLNHELLLGSDDFKGDWIGGVPDAEQELLEDVGSRLIGRGERQLKFDRFGAPPASLCLRLLLVFRR